MNNKIPPSRFVLKGFVEDHGLRRFTFEALEADRVRTQFTVHADLALLRGYGIHIQDLPLLCRELLERADSGAARSLTFTEEDMRLCSADRLVAKQAAAQKRKPPRRPTPNAAVAASPFTLLGDRN